jgi:hypothetical protein
LIDKDLTQREIHSILLGQLFLQLYTSYLFWFPLLT